MLSSFYATVNVRKLRVTLTCPFPELNPRVLRVARKPRELKNYHSYLNPLSWRIALWDQSIRKYSRSADTINPDGMDTFPPLPAMTAHSLASLPAHVLESQPSPAKKFLDEWHSTIEVPTIGGFYGAPLPLPSPEGLEVILYLR